MQILFLILFFSVSAFFLRGLYLKGKEIKRSKQIFEIAIEKIDNSIKKLETPFLVFSKILEEDKYKGVQLMDFSFSKQNEKLTADEKEQVVKEILKIAIELEQNKGD